MDPISARLHQKKLKTLDFAPPCRFFTKSVLREHEGVISRESNPSRRQSKSMIGNLPLGFLNETRSGDAKQNGVRMARRVAAGRPPRLDVIVLIKLYPIKTMKHYLSMMKRKDSLARGGRWAGCWLIFPTLTNRPIAFINKPITLLDPAQIEHTREKKRQKYVTPTVAIQQR